MKKDGEFENRDDLFQEASPLKALGLQTVTYQNIEMTNLHINFS